MMAKMMMANRTSNAICNSGAIAFKIEKSTTCRPKMNAHIVNVNKCVNNDNPFTVKVNT